jgi:hypothetical protein
MAWSEQTVSDERWLLRGQSGGTLWDGGDTRWDVRGEVARTYWDVPAGEVFTVQAPGGQTWTEQ